MFQVSRRADYAMRIMVALGQREEGASLTAREISRHTAVPKAFLHKITTDLVKASLVRTSSGTTGGLALARPAASITVLHIVEAVEGPICVNVCLVRPRECPRDLICPAHSMWGRVQAQIIAELQATTVAHLAAEAHLLKQVHRPRSNAYLFPASTESPLAAGGTGS